VIEEDEDDSPVKKKKEAKQPYIPMGSLGSKLAVVDEPIETEDDAAI